ncbi:MAG: hypothetical protein MMC33_007062 [Icmadophila ericetorum]|nr:hypothetical protein [Icmadophila ericetorum]
MLPKEVSGPRILTGSFPSLVASSSAKILNPLMTHRITASHVHPLTVPTATKRESVELKGFHATSPRRPTPANPLLKQENHSTQSNPSLSTSPPTTKSREVPRSRVTTPAIPLPYLRRRRNRDNLPSVSGIFKLGAASTTLTNDSPESPESPANTRAGVAGDGDHCTRKGTSDSRFSVWGNEYARSNVRIHSGLSLPENTAISFDDYGEFPTLPQRPHAESKSQASHPWSVHQLLQF